MASRFRSFPSVLASVFLMVCDYVALWTGTLSVSRCPSGDSLLDRLFQQHAESTHLCVFQQVSRFADVFLRFFAGKINKEKFKSFLKKKCLTQNNRISTKLIQKPLIELQLYGFQLFVYETFVSLICMVFEIVQFLKMYSS